MFRFRKQEKIDFPDASVASPAQGSPFRNKLMELSPKNAGRWMREKITVCEKKTLGKFGVRGGFMLANILTKTDYALEAANLGTVAIAITYSSGAMSVGAESRIDAVLRGVSGVLNYFSSISEPALNAASWAINLFTPASGQVHLDANSKEVALFILCTIVSKAVLKIGVWVEFAQAMMVDTLVQMSKKKDGFFLRNSAPSYNRESVREQVIDGALFFVPLPVELLRRPWAIRSKMRQARAIGIIREKFGEPKSEGAG
ncbi:MAG: hypothetical protein WCT52_03505 [Candidatus Micrarchaeia archaeon]